MRQSIHAMVWAYRHLRGRYASPEAQFMARHLDPASIAVDIGAHAGTWCIPLSRALRQGSVIAVEALPYYAETLRHLFGWLRCRNIRLVNVAVTRQPCRVQMIWKDARGRRLTGWTHVAAKGETSDASIDVEGCPLDAIVGRDADRVGFVKVDVEGGEVGVLEGGRKLIQDRRPIVYAEVSKENLARYGTTPADVFRFFEDLGYRRYVFASPDTLSPFEDLEQTGRGDVLFAPKGTRNLPGVEAGL